jgi:hypothetical protein
MSTTQIMRPGILVALNTSVRGGVHYTRRDLENDGSVARWETTRQMEDPEEHKRAQEVRSLASSAIWRLCIHTTFGLLCPLEREEELDLAAAAARSAVDLWNAQASHTWVTVNVVKGRIADNDEEALRALLAEATDLVERMDQGLARADVSAIRAAASKARSLIEIMDEESGERISEAVEAARKAAREIVKRVGVEGQSAEEAVASINREAFDKARFAFLDIAESELDALPAVDVQRMAEIEAYRDEMLASRKAVA